MTRLALFTAALALMLSVAVPAFAVTGAGGAGVDYSTHIVAHVQDMGGFTGAMNPGVMHQGFSGYTAH
jgi:hypothetical protein